MLKDVDLRQGLDEVSVENVLESFWKVGLLMMVLMQVWCGIRRWMLDNAGLVLLREGFRF